MVTGAEPLETVSRNLPPEPMAAEVKEGAAAELTVTITSAEPSTGFGFGVVAVTEAALRDTPTSLACIVRFNCAPALLVRLPTFQFKFWPDRTTEPNVAFEEIRENPR